METFELVLPSNTYHSTFNKPSNFTVPLPKGYDFSEYSVGLKSISYNKSWYTLKESDTIIELISSYHYKDDTFFSTTTTFPHGFYTSEEQLIEYINSAIKKTRIKTNDNLHYHSCYEFTSFEKEFSCFSMNELLSESKDDGLGYYISFKSRFKYKANKCSFLASPYEIIKISPTLASILGFKYYGSEICLKYNLLSDNNLEIFEKKFEDYISKNILSHYINNPEDFNFDLSQKNILPYMINSDITRNNAQSNTPKEHIKNITQNFIDSLDENEFNNNFDYSVFKNNIYFDKTETALNFNNTYKSNYKKLLNVLQMFLVMGGAKHPSPLEVLLFSKGLKEKFSNLDAFKNALDEFETNNENRNYTPIIMKTISNYNICGIDLPHYNIFGIDLPEREVISKFESKFGITTDDLVKEDISSFSKKKYKNHNQNLEALLRNSQIKKIPFPGFINFEQGENSNIYVYCDLITPQITGSKQLQLLKVFPTNINGKNKLFSNIYMDFTNVSYKQISKKHINEIKILLCNDIGNEINFTEGHVIVTLEFKKENNFLRKINNNLEKMLLLMEKENNVSMNGYPHKKREKK